MAGGFLAGVLSGAVVSGVALGALSLAVGSGTDNAPGAAAVTVPAGSGFNQARDDTTARLPEADGGPVIAGKAPRVGAVAPDDLSQVAAEDTEPGTRPDVATPEAQMTAPQAGESDNGLTGSGAEESSSAGVAQTAPNPAGDALSISTDPAQPSLPEVGDGTNYALQGSDTSRSPDAPSYRQDQAGSAVEVVPTEPGGDDAGESAPSGTIGDMARGVERLSVPSAGESPTEEWAIDATQSGGAAADLPAIEAYAAPFDNPEGKPLMSVVLIHDGSNSVGPEALESFPYPLSVAVDATRSDAPAAMRRYRDAGFEVIAIADMPEDATARDAETTMQKVEATLPEAVAVLEGTGEGLRAGRDVSEQLAAILNDSGRGLVLSSDGPRTAAKLIAQEGVPVGSVFRDFGAGDQSATEIRRLLDRAALKAGHDEGGVIMLGRLRADTISALRLWGQQDKAKRVALAPVSAVLMAGPGDGGGR